MTTAQSFSIMQCGTLDIPAKLRSRLPNMDLWWTNPVGTSTMMSNNNNHCLTTTTTVANNNNSSSSSNNTNTKTAMPAAIDSEDATTAPPRKHNGETTNNPVSTAAPPRNRSGETNSVSATVASPRNHNREPNNPVATTAPLRNHNDETNNPVSTAVPPRNHNVETNAVCGGGGCHSGSARGGSGGGHHRHVRDDGAAASSSAVVVTEPQHMAVLSYEQVKRLDGVMDLVVPITGRGNFPDLEVKLKDLVQVVRAKLERDGVKVRDVRLNGGAACHVLAATDNTAQPYNDLDLIFGVDLGTPRHFDKVKAAVLESLLDFLPEGVSKTRISSCSLKEAYVHKMVKVTEGDRWSLISLSNARGKNVELKFVDAMKRQFEFSVDSFHIHLDTLLLFYDCAVDMPLSDSFYPTVVGESVYGDFRESLLHLHRKLIATRNPEEIRGGGLLKYCNLLVRGYTPVNLDEIKTLQRYMCSRFFIDFSDLSQQQQKLYCYLANHFVGEEHLVPQYLSILYQVVDESTVCLMGHERRQTLGLIEEFYYYLQGQQQLQRLGGATSSSKGGGNTVATSSGLLNNCSIHVIYGGGAPQHATGGFYYTPYVTPTLPGGGAHHHHHRQHHYYSCWMPCA